MSTQTTTPETSCCGSSPQQASARNAGVTFQPAVDIYETADEFVIAADVPGATNQNVDITLEDGLLSVRAGVAPRHSGQTSLLVREYGVGDYERSFRVGSSIDPGRISAEVVQGILTIRLPKSESVKPRKIAIQSNN